MYETPGDSGKRYHVFGMGNALVDMEFKVEGEFLDRMEVAKGVMTLVEEERQDQLLTHLGENILKKACGGSAANTIIAIVQLGGKAYYSCKVASDEYGHFYLQDLQAEGVATNPHPQTSAGKTGKCLVMVTPDAERTMNTYLGITATYSEENIDYRQLAQSQWLYIEGYLVASPEGKEAAIKARKFAQAMGVKTALTLSDPAMVQYFHSGLVEMIGDKVDLIFCNEKEAYGFLGVASLEDACREMQKYATQFVITLGERGAFIFDGKDFELISPYGTTAVDTNGAGDMFAGAFLYGVTNGLNLAQSGKLAARAAAEVVSKFGPRLTKNLLEKIASEVLSPNMW